VGGVNIARDQLDKKVNNTSKQNTASCHKQKFESISGDEGHSSRHLLRQRPLPHSLASAPISLMIG
jgi:hypothetical protein